VRVGSRQRLKATASSFQYDIIEVPARATEYEAQVTKLLKNTFEADRRIIVARQNLEKYRAQGMESLEKLLESLDRKHALDLEIQKHISDCTNFIADMMKFDS
jgi:ribosome assembly protein YihI (activator of Der GTPase)